MSQRTPCPLGDPSQCRFDASLELSAGRGLVQSNCTVCGLGASIQLPMEAALELHDELHRHREPPAPPDIPPGNEPEPA